MTQFWRLLFELDQEMIETADSSCANLQLFFGKHFYDELINDEKF